MWHGMPLAVDCECAIYGLGHLIITGMINSGVMNQEATIDMTDSVSISFSHVFSMFVTIKISRDRFVLHFYNALAAKKMYIDFIVGCYWDLPAQSYTARVCHL